MIQTGTTFERELERLINRHSIENHSDTRDWILAEYIRNCLNAYSLAVKCRDRMAEREPCAAPSESSTDG